MPLPAEGGQSAMIRVGDLPLVTVTEADARKVGDGCSATFAS
jgi:hypothetical protein